jgi:hypothetical protein
MIYWLLFILADIIGNYFVIEVKKSRPNYLQLFTIRGITAIVHASLIMQVVDLRTWVPVLAYQLASHFTLFSPGLNLARSSIRRKHNWFTYRGKDSGWLDSIANGNYPWVYWTMYAVAFGNFTLTIFGL